MKRVNLIIKKYLNESSIKLERINKAIDDLKKTEKLNISNMASYLRQELKDNEPCPVCGSISNRKNLY